jgi:hypothetical protein
MSYGRSANAARSNAFTTGQIMSSSLDPSRAREGYLRTTVIHEGTEIVDQNDQGHCTVARPRRDQHGCTGGTPARVGQAAPSSTVT